MCNSRWVGRRVLFSAAVVVAGIAGSPPPAGASMSLLVPAYIYPGTGGPNGVGDGWDDLIAAARQVSVTAIFNPASGPAAAYSPQYGAYLTGLENAGGKAVAYVWTDYGQASLGTVEGEIQTYISQYGKLINGFLLDGMSGFYDTTTADVTYYNTLYNYIKGLSSSYQIIGNPGGPTTTAYLNPAAPTANTIQTFENAASYYTSANTIAGYPSSQFANTIYAQSSVAGMEADIAFAAQNNVGYIYVTDQQLPNPYSQLPSYWDQEVAAIAALSVPEPCSLTLLASAWVFSCLGMAANGMKRGKIERHGSESGKASGARARTAPCSM